MLDEYIEKIQTFSIYGIRDGTFRNVDCGAEGTSNYLRRLLLVKPQVT